MKTRHAHLFLLLCLAGLALAVDAVAQTQSQNRNSIRGRITNTERRPLERIRVELLNEVEMLVKQVYTDGMGRYDFNGLSLGTFHVRANSNGVYAGQTVRIQIVSARMGGGGSQQEMVDFVLYTMQQVNNPGVPGNSGVAFAQDVPENARKLYDKAVDLFGQQKTEQGVEAMKEALKVFTNYFQAWERLGIEYIKLEHYDAAHLALTQAIKINANAANSLYGLGYVQYKAGQWRNAAQSLDESLRLAPDSANAPFAHFYCGLALLKENQPGNAELHLKQASTLGRDKVPAEAHLHLAQIYSNSKRYKEAADELELYVKRAPKDADMNKFKELIKQLRSKAANAPAAKLLSDNH